MAYSTAAVFSFFPVLPRGLQVEEIGFWANSGYLGSSWLGAMASYLAGANHSFVPSR